MPGILFYIIFLTASTEVNIIFKTRHTFRDFFLKITKSMSSLKRNLLRSLVGIDIIFVLRNGNVRIHNNCVIVQYAVKTFTINSARKGKRKKKEKKAPFFLQRVILLNYCLF